MTNTNTNIKYAMAEVVEYLKGVRKEDIEKISPKFLEFLYENAANDYVSNFDYKNILTALKLSQDAKGILCYICYTYWCNDAEDKEKFKEILQLNEQKYEEELKRQTENMFNRKENNFVVEEESKDENSIEEPTSSLPIEEPKKEGLVSRIINFFRNMFKRK